MGRSHPSLTRATAGGFALGLAFILVLTLLSGLLTSRRKAGEVAREALASEGVMDPWAHVDEDYFTECAVLMLLTARPDDLARNAIESWLPPEALTLGHPCVAVQRYAEGALRYSTPPSPRPYVNYWFGSRHLEAVVFRVLTFTDARTLYLLLSSGAVVVLALASWHSDRQSGLVLMPVFLALLLGFSLHLHGHNLAHAPGFFIGFSLLAVLVARRRHFESFERRLFFFAFLAVVVSFFDLLNGPLVVVLSLSVALNHFFYSRNESRRSSLAQPVWIVGCFACCYVLVTALHLALLDVLHDGVWQQYLYGLGVRLGRDVNSTLAVGAGDIASALWKQRSYLVIGGSGPSTWFLFGGLVAWLFAAAALPLGVKRGGGARLLTDVTVVAMAGGGVLAWYLLLPSHTFIHAPFTVRYLALPAAYGAVAAVLVVLRLAAPRTHRLRSLAAAGALSGISALVAAHLLHSSWGLNAQQYEARFLRGVRTDRVSCAPLGLTPDGRTDGLVEINARTPLPPLTLLHLRPERPSAGHVDLRLRRLEPPGTWETGTMNDILGVSRTASGPLINDGDGKVELAGGGRYYLHYCNDAAEPPHPLYRVVADGRVVRTR